MCWQFAVRAVDGGGGLSLNTAWVNISIQRNEADPRFPDSQCTEPLDAGIGLFVTIFTITATDSDSDLIGSSAVNVSYLPCLQLFQSYLVLCLCTADSQNFTSAMSVLRFQHLYF